MNVLAQLLEIITLAATAAQAYPNGEVQAGAKIAGELLAIVQKSVAAYEQHTGEPLDLALLHPIEPIP